MKLTKDFYNKLAETIRKKFFPDVKFYRDNKQCEKACYTIELFNNGAVNYKYLVKNLSLICRVSEESMHNIVKEFIEDFEGYNFKPKKIKISLELSEKSVKIFTAAGVKIQDIPKLWKYIIEDAIDEHTMIQGDYIQKWLDNNDFEEVLQ